MAKSKEKPVEKPEEQSVKNVESLSDKIFKDTHGLCIPVELAKDYAAYAADSLKSLYWKAKVKIADITTGIKIAKDYDIEYIDNPGEGEPKAKMVPKGQSTKQ
jgi:hypothetical protein